jgi:hypothetical protein
MKSALVLPQTIELERGDAAHLYWAVASVWTQAQQAPLQVVPVPVAGDLLIALPLLQRLGKRLYTAYQTEACWIGKQRRRPKTFRFSCEEVVVVMRHVLPVAPEEAAPVLGKVQQKSLNLARYVHI